jgi:hypothetical protein
METWQESFFAKVNKTDTCWLWTAGLRDGYGSFWANSKNNFAHKYLYEKIHGKLKKGIVLDHRCRVRKCVNPKHVRPVTRRKNVLENSEALAALNAKKTHCLNGHPFTESSIYRRKDGKIHRVCRPCANARASAHYYGKS